MKNVNIFLVAIITFLVSTSAISQTTATYNEVITKKKKGKINTYITEDGESFSVGDNIKLGVAFRNENFDFISQNAGLSYYPLPNSASNSVVTIKRIDVRSRTVIVRTTRPQGFVYGLIIKNFESAILNGEVISNMMTSDKALEELKKWKDKYDLELITKEEYEQKKKELSKHIK